MLDVRDQAAGGADDLDMSGLTMDDDPADDLDMSGLTMTPGEPPHDDM